MAKAAVFDSELEAKTAFELGGEKLVFKCNQCGGNHRVGSKAAQRCFKKARERFPSYTAEIYYMRYYIPWLEDPWSCWGREDAMAEYCALNQYVESYIWHPISVETYSFEDHMLALGSEALDAVERENFEKASAVYGSRVNEDFMRRLNRLMELGAYFRAPRPPALPLPVVVNFIDSKISCGGGKPADLESFFRERVKEAVGHLEPFPKLYADVDAIVSKLIVRPMRWQNVKVGYFLSHGAYLAAVHDWVCGSYSTRKFARYGSYQYLIFCLRNYRCPEIIDVSFGDHLSAEELINRLIKVAEARRDAA